MPAQPRFTSKMAAARLGLIEGVDESRNQTTPFSRSCVSQTKGNIGKSHGPSIGLLVFPSVGLWVHSTVNPS